MITIEEPKQIESTEFKDEEYHHVYNGVGDMKTYFFPDNPALCGYIHPNLPIMIRLPFKLFKPCCPICLALKQNV